MIRTLQRHWFICALVATLVVGAFGHADLEPMVAHVPRHGVIFAVLLAMTLPLRIEAMWSVLRQPLPALIAVGINGGVLPLMAWAVSPLLDGQLSTGLIVAAVVPCTIASAAVWTRRAGGNDAVALFVTMLTNLFCFLVIPAWLHLTVGRAEQALDDYGAIVVKLALVVVLPIVTAQVLCKWMPRLGDWATRNKQELGLFCQFGILTMVLIGAIQCGQTLSQLDQNWRVMAGQIVVMLGLVALLHLLAWFLGYWLSRCMGFSRADGLAVAFAGSQKTLMVGLAVALDYGGLAVLPMMAYHAFQLLADTVLADWQRTRRST
jgi:solute carrier family 10 (sodium/bile acid cotransporter), member 7